MRPIGWWVWQNTNSTMSTTSRATSCTTEFVERFWLFVDLFYNLLWLCCRRSLPLWICSTACCTTNQQQIEVSGVCTLETWGKVMLKRLKRLWRRSLMTVRPPPGGPIATTRNISYIPPQRVAWLIAVNSRALVLNTEHIWTRWLHSYSYNVVCGTLTTNSIKSFWTSVLQESSK